MESKIINKWESLQRQIQYEMTIESQCKSELEIIKDQLKNLIKIFFERKVDLQHYYNLNMKQILQPRDNSIPKYTLVDNTKSEFNNYYKMIEQFLMELKKEKGLLIASIKGLPTENSDDIINFICNFCFEDPFDPLKSEEELLEAICIFLQEEVNALKQPSAASFLDNKPVSILIKGLSRRIEIKNFLSRLLEDVILDMDNMSSPSLGLEINSLIEAVKKNKEGNNGPDLNKIEIRNRSASQKADPKSRVFDLDDDILLPNPKDIPFMLSNNLSASALVAHHDEDVFDYGSELLFPAKIINVDNFLDNRTVVQSDEAFTIFTEKELNYRLKDKRTSEVMKEFYQSQINYREKEKVEYTNDKLIDNLSKHDVSVLHQYKKNFEKIKFFIDKFLLNLKQNLIVVPYSIKVICKIIDVLIMKKFPTISRVERNAFVSEFLIGKLVIPTLTNPDYNGIITNSIISGITRKNLIYLTKFLKKIFRANFFNSSFEQNFTVFNSYIAEIFPFVSDFITEIKNVKLPSKIEDILNIYQKEPNEIKKETDSEKDIFEYQTVCFSYLHFQSLINYLIDNESILESKTKNMTLINCFKEVKKNINDIRKIFLDDISTVKYYLICNTEFNVIHQKRKGNMADELNTAKYCIQQILRNLNPEHFKVNHFLCNSYSSYQLFNIISKIAQLEDFSSIKNNTEETVPLGWYCVLLELTLSKLSEEYKKDDYDKLHNEILDEVKNRIFELQNDKGLIQLQMFLSRGEQMITMLNNDILKSKQLQRYINVYKFIYTANIKCNIKKEKDDSLTIHAEEDLKSYNCESILKFIEQFQSLEELKKDLTENDKKKKATHLLWDYLNIIRDNLKKCQENGICSEFIKETLENQDHIDRLLDDIEEFINDKIYFQIYPSEPNKEDIDFYNKCCSLENITYDEIGINKKFVNQVNERLWLVASSYISRMEIEKTPVKKLCCLESMYKVLNNCIIFSSGKKDGGVDDILPMFVYIIIKAKPKKYFTDINFIECLINPDKMMGTFGFLGIQAESAKDFIMNYGQK
ncbi:MAG: hypothetical protein MJ252_06550 [archaeon]|nr:hypothetical protein [archaeon]